MRSIKLSIILTALCLAMLVPGFNVSANSAFTERWVQEIEEDFYSEPYVTKEGDVLLAVSKEGSNAFHKYDGKTGKKLVSFELNNPSQILRDGENNLFIYYFDTDTFEIHLYDDTGQLLWKQPYPKLEGENFGEYLGFSVTISNNLLNISKAYQDVQSYSLSDGSLVSVSPYIEDPRYAIYPDVSLEGNNITYKYLDEDGYIQSISTEANVPESLTIEDTFFTNNNNQINFYIKTKDKVTGKKTAIRNIFDEDGQIKLTQFLNYNENFQPYSLRDFIYLDQVNLTHEPVLIDQQLVFFDTDGSIVNSPNLESTEIDILTGIDKAYLFAIAGDHAFLFKNNGELVWKKDMSALFDGEGYAKFVQPDNQMDPTKIYIQYGQKIIQLDKQDGTIIWTYDAGHDFSFPNIHEPSNTLFYKSWESGKEKLYAINTAITSTVESDKVWTVTFSGNVNPKSVNLENMYILNSINEKVSVSFKVEDDKVFIQPPAGGYAIDAAYTIHVEKSVSSTSGKSLKTKVDEVFYVK